MKKGEVVKIERLESGFYKITYPDGVCVIGAAASTAIALAYAVFHEEASHV